MSEERCCRLNILGVHIGQEEQFLWRGVIAILIVYLRERSSKNKKGKKKGKKMNLLKRMLNYSGGWVPPRIRIPNNKVHRLKRNEERKKNIDSLKESIKKMKKYKRKG